MSIRDSCLLLFMFEIWTKKIKQNVILYRQHWTECGAMNDVLLCVMCCRLCDHVCKSMNQRKFFVFCFPSNIPFGKWDDNNVHACVECRRFCFYRLKMCFYDKNLFELWVTMSVWHCSVLCSLLSIVVYICSVRCFFCWTNIDFHHFLCIKITSTIDTLAGGIAPIFRALKYQLILRVFQLLLIFIEIEQGQSWMGILRCCIGFAEVYERRTLFFNQR